MILKIDDKWLDGCDGFVSIDVEIMCLDITTPTKRVDRQGRLDIAIRGPLFVMRHKVETT